MDEDQIEGLATDVKGKVKYAAGGLTGDTGLQAEGKLDQASGKIQGKMGAAKEQLSDAADKVTDKASEYAGKVTDKLKNAAQNMGGTTEDLYDAGSRASSYVQNLVKERPWLSLLGVAVASYALAFIIRSPSKPQPTLAETARKRLR